MFHLVSDWLVLGAPKVYQNLGCFTRMWGFYLDGVWLWRISGGYSQETVLVLGQNLPTVQSYI